MLTGLYAAGSGLAAAYRGEQVLAHDTANAETPGFAALVPMEAPWRPAGVVATGPGGAVPLGRVPWGVAGGTALDTVAGAPRQTQDALAAAPVTPNTYFAVQTPAGVRYTRVGAFTRTAAGVVVTPSGLPVLGVGGRPLTVPAGTRVQADGSLVAASGRVVGHLALYTVAAPRPAGQGLYAGAAVVAAGGRVLPAAVVGSNVSLSITTADLIASQRTLQADAQAVQAENTAAQQVETQVG